MLSLFNGMHRTDIMSEIVSGRRPFLSAPHIPLEMKRWMDGCPRCSDSAAFLTDLLAPVCDSHAVLQQVQMLSFFSGENIMVAVFSGMGGKKRPCSAKWPVWKIDVVNMVSRPLWNMIKIDLKLIKPIFHILRTCFTLYLTYSYIFDLCACGSLLNNYSSKIFNYYLTQQDK